MALQGTLDTFSLPDVLRLLATTSKTGRLRIEGDRGHGSVWLTDGNVVEATAERAMDGTPVDEVLFELLRFQAGSFAFDGDDRAAGGKDPEEIEGLLRRANSLLSEWSELENVVPSLEHEVRLANDLSVDEVIIDADRWKSLVAVAAGRTVGELATTLSLTELGVSRAVRDLVDLGVAEVDPPGTGPVAARRPRSPGLDVPRRPAPRPEPESMAPVGRQAPLTGETPRAGWYQTGEMPAVGPDRRPPSTGNGRARASNDDTVATPPPAPAPAADPPSKGGLTSRLGRNRNANAGPPAGDRTPTGQTPPVTGSTPRATGSTPSIANGSARPSARPPTAPPARTNDLGRARNGAADTGPTTRTAPRNAGPDTAPTSRPAPRGAGPDTGPTSRPAPRSGAADTGATARVDRKAPRNSGPERPSRSGSPSGPGSGRPDATAPFDGGRLGPPPSSRDTGQIRPATPSSLPPDLHWAADDTGGGSVNGTAASSPFSGLSSLGPTRPMAGQGLPGPGLPGPGAPGPGLPGPGPSRPPARDGEIAPHVAAMSPEARAAVQSTLGNAGGSTGGRGGSQGEDIAQRGRLISFLSTVR